MGKGLFLTTIAASALLGYAIYFDYARRNSPEFRKNLRKSAKSHKRQFQAKNEQDKKAKLEIIKEELNKSLKEAPIPTDLAEKEQFFMLQVSQGEQLSTVPGQEIASAISFYKALSVYPNPTDILSIYQRSVPENVYELLVMMIAVQPPAAVSNILGDSVGSVATAGIDVEQD